MIASRNVQVDGQLVAIPLGAEESSAVVLTVNVAAQPAAGTTAKPASTDTTTTANRTSRRYRQAPGHPAPASRCPPEANTPNTITPPNPDRAPDRAPN
jgi:hypothetical protein